MLIVTREGDRRCIDAICRTLTWAGTPAAASTYHAAKRRPASPRSLPDAGLVTLPPAGM